MAGMTSRSLCNKSSVAGLTRFAGRSTVCKHVTTASRMHHVLGGVTGRRRSVALGMINAKVRNAFTDRCPSGQYARKAGFLVNGEVARKRPRRCVTTHRNPSIGCVKVLGTYLSLGSCPEESKVEEARNVRARSLPDRPPVRIQRTEHRVNRRNP